MKISETTEKRIWNYLNSKIQNPYGTAGLMGNLYAESGLLSINLQDTFQKTWNITDKQYTSNVDRNIYQDFINDGAGYGLAQWTYPTRKQALLEFAINRKVSIGNLKMQLDFLLNELSTSFKSVYNGLKNSKSIEEASNLVLTEFEKPRVINDTVKRQRQNYSQIYLSKYGKINTTKVENILPQKDKYNLNIIKKCGTTNTNYLPNRTISFIVLHYTAGLTSKAGSAINLASACANGGLNSSAEFYVDDAQVVQYIDDIRNRYSWSVGGNKYPQMTTTLGGKYYGICTNMNSINIEICNEKINKNSYKATDTDWYFTEAALKNAIALTRFLMDQYNIDIDHVIMHHSVNGKNCLPYDNTELLTPKGWIPLEKISVNDTVVQYNKEDDCLEYGKVKAVIEPHEDKVFKLRGFEATAEHRSLTRGSYKNALWNINPWLLDYKARQRVFMTNSFMRTYKGLPLSDEEIQLLVWIQGDGHYMKASDNKTITGIEFHLKKNRKILRIREILDSLGYEYKENWCKNGTVHIRIYNLEIYNFAEKWLKNKVFTYKILEMTLEQFNVFWEELLKVDGSVEKNSYCSTIQQNYDVVQALCAIHGRRTLQTTTGSSTSLLSTTSNLNSTYLSKREERITIVGCVTVDTGFILVRQSGRTFITGNCPAMWTMKESDLSGYYNFIDKVKNAEVISASKVSASTTINNSKSNFTPYLVRIAVSALNIRDGAGIEYKINDTIRDKNLYTIIEEKNGWGKLKSGIGWINLKYIERV